MEPLDQDYLVQTILSGKAGRDTVLELLYRHRELRSRIEGYLRSNNASQSDIDSLFVNTLMQFVKLVVRRQRLDIATSVENYLVGICRYLWYAELRQQKRYPISYTDQLEAHFAEVDISPEQQLINDERLTNLQTVIQHMGDRCREVLLLWANGVTMKQIADTMQYKSEAMAKKKKYQCWQRLLQFLADHPSIKEKLR